MQTDPAKAGPLIWALCGYQCEFAGNHMIHAMIFG